VPAAKRLVLLSLPLLCTLATGTVAGYLYWCVATLPDITVLESYAPYEASKIFSYDNELLTEFYIERRNYLPHRDIPRHVKNAFIAVEDRHFYRHIGIDIIRIGGAVIQDIRQRAFVEGGSTITQQLAKMLFLTPEKTITRKIKEIALAFKVEARYSKDEILGMYLNHAYLGTRAYGIEAAAQTYVGKSAQSLSIAEAAMLATLPKAPSRRSPFKDPVSTAVRRNKALKRMAAMGAISAAQDQQAVRAPLPSQVSIRDNKSPHFVDYVRSVLEDRYGARLYTAGLKIYTTLDYSMQLAAEHAVARGLEALQHKGITGVQAALFAVEADTGRIRAMVGGTRYRESQFNRATQAKRQPGSTFKPFVYLTALTMGYTPDNIIDDAKVTYRWREGIWTPQNYNGIYLGKVSMNDALAKSLNAATVGLARKIGMANIIRTAGSLGITSTIRPYDSSALGTSELTLEELVCAYAAMSHGYRIRPEAIDKIIDRDQPYIIEPASRRVKALDGEAVRHIKTMLRSVVLDGTAQKALALDRPVYGKTGTTDNYADAWFIGFDDTFAVGVWVGRDDHDSIGPHETGSRAALPIWIEFMKSIGNRKGPGRAQFVAAAEGR